VNAASCESFPRHHYRRGPELTCCAPEARRRVRRGHIRSASAPGVDGAEPRGLERRMPRRAGDNHAAGRAR